MIPTNEWQEYDHDYEKELQDIKTKDGKTYLFCWPNAGVWHTSNNQGKQVPDEEVTHIRLSKN